MRALLMGSCTSMMLPFLHLCVSVLLDFFAAVLIFYRQLWLANVVTVVDERKGEGDGCHKLLGWTSLLFWHCALVGWLAIPSLVTVITQRDTSVMHHGWCRGGAIPVTDAMQRVAPALDERQTQFDHAQISTIKDIQHRNKRLVVHHYASRSFADYQTKLARGAGDKKRSNHLRGMGFFNVLNACVLRPVILSVRIVRAVGEEAVGTHTPTPLWVADAAMLVQ